MNLSRLEIRSKDEKRPFDVQNCDVYLNGELIGYVQNIKVEFDGKQPLGPLVKLEFYASVDIQADVEN